MRVSGLILCALLAAAGGCKKRVSPPDYGSIPHLPAPTSGTYASLPQPPQDEVVAQLAPEALRWDASLTGGAAGLALAAVGETGGLRRFEVREALWQAGYPYPPREVRGWSVAQGGVPPEEVRQWLGAIPGASYGLVRARSARGDVWVGLVAEPRVDLGTLPRQVELGEQVVLPALEAKTLRVSDPNGAIHESALSTGRNLTLSLPGEWLLEVRDTQGVAALFPLYVGVEPPTGPVLSPPDEPPSSADEVLAHTRMQLRRIREAYGLEVLSADTLLDQGAQGVLDGTSTSAGLRARTLTCAGETVEDCLDRMLWDLESRQVLVDPAMSFSGTAVRADMDGIHVVVLIAG